MRPQSPKVTSDGQVDELPHRPVSAKLTNFWAQISRTWRHPANASGRTRALLRLGTFHFRAQVLHERTRVPIGAHSTMWADRRFACSAEVAIGNPPDWRDMEVWRHYLGPGTLFVDIGANAGTYSLWAADLGAAVLAVEPEPVVRHFLEENAALNGYEFEVAPIALSDAPGTMQFTRGLGTMNHLVPDGAHGDIEVEVQTLDDLLGDRLAHGVKIDVEGAERFVLAGATRALVERRLPVIQLEWNRMSKKVFGEDRQPLAKLLAGYGYRFFRPDEQGRLVAADESVIGDDLFAVLQ